MLQNLPGHAKSAPGSLVGSGDLTGLPSLAFQHWEMIQGQLARTIKRYLEACVALDSACTPTSSSFPCLPENSYLKVNAELFDRSGEDMLQKARGVL
ncbi:hypothetical protein FRC06_010368, partial [Ceratobasidium sp. 370]